MKLLTTINIFVVWFMASVLFLDLDLELKDKLLTYSVFGGFVYILLLMYITDNILSKMETLRAIDPEAFSTLLSRVYIKIVYHKMSLLFFGLMNALIAEYYVWSDDVFYSYLVAIFAGLTFVSTLAWFTMFNSKKLLPPQQTGDH